MIEVRDLSPGDGWWVRATLQDGWGSSAVARLGDVVDAATLAGALATVDGTPVGLVTWRPDAGDLEVVTIQSLRPGLGVGRALMDRTWAEASAIGAERLWLVTTNDNLRALRFYQRWGMDLVALHRDGVARSRTLKASIPLTGADGIPIRHELELERRRQPSR